MKSTNKVVANAMAAVARNAEGDVKDKQVLECGKKTVLLLKRIRHDIQNHAGSVPTSSKHLSTSTISMAMSLIKDALDEADTNMLIFAKQAKDGGFSF